jgi:uncharacterized protein (DUF1697 family)
MEQMVAFLRGINLGKRNIKMDDLRQAFADLGFGDARTLIASGNVLFSAKPAPDLEANIAAGLANRFGFEITTIIRTVNALVELADSDPFKGHDAGPDVKFYTYFLAQPDIERIALTLSVPGDFEVVQRTDREIFAVAYRMDNGRFGPGLDKFDKPFGQGVTNRNWNTVLRLIEKAKT